MPGGRPKKYTDGLRAELLEAFFVYIEENDIPILAEFAYENGVPRQKIYEFEEFSDAIQLCHCKKEANLEKGALTRAIDPGMAKFSLAQLGWSEKSQISGAGGAPLVPDKLVVEFVKHTDT